MSFFCICVTVPLFLHRLSEHNTINSFFLYKSILLMLSLFIVFCSYVRDVSAGKKKTLCIATRFPVFWYVCHYSIVKYLYSLASYICVYICMYIYISGSIFYGLINSMFKKQCLVLIRE